MQPEALPTTHLDYLDAARRGYIRYRDIPIRFRRPYKPTKDQMRAEREWRRAHA